MLPMPVWRYEREWERGDAESLDEVGCQVLLWLENASMADYRNSPSNFRSSRSLPRSVHRYPTSDPSLPSENRAARQRTRGIPGNRVEGVASVDSLSFRPSSL